MSNRLILIDGHAVLFRAFYAYPPLNTPSGELVNAVYGFTSILLNVIRELRPTHIAASFDLGKPTFRHTSFEAYKANRAETPQELIDQEGRVQQVVQALNVPVYTKEGFEADDVIGTIAHQVVWRGPTTAAHQADARRALDDKLDFKSLSSLSNVGETEVIIVTGDKDAFQLVVDEAPGGSVGVYMPGRNRQPSMIYDEAEVAARFEGLKPEHIVDMKGLAGDPSDNIPGVKGIGQKTAIKLLKQFDSIEKIYAKVEEVLRLSGSSHLARSAPSDAIALAGRQDDKVDLKSLSTLSSVMGVGKSVVEKLIAGRESAFASKKLATIVRDVPMEFEMEKAILTDYDKHGVVKLFDELGFRSLLAKLPNDSFEQSVQEALF